MTTPLTLEFSPDTLEGDGVSNPYIVAEPSRLHAGRIFLAANGIGRRAGLHLLPSDARRLRDHLTMLLMEQPEDPEEDPIHPDDTDPALHVISLSGEGSELTDEEIARISALIGSGGPVPVAPEPPRIHFNFQFRLGPIAGMIGRIT